ncbi:hypothetical protein [Streptomyces sp. NPDC001389]|uniref:hypothetical protein n=1 Tax=Streptomyces sp. NPDC001389 TaxID=3364569 RepID=UPI00369FA43E
MLVRESGGAPCEGGRLWAIQEVPGEWGITQLGAGAVVDRIDQPIVDPQARAELKLLLRASLPDSDQAAISRLHGQLPQVDLRAALLRLPGWWCAHDPHRFYTPGGHGNFGMAHGIAGPLALLAQAPKRGVAVDGQREAIASPCPSAGAGVPGVLRRPAS